MSLYDQIGGAYTINAAVDIFYSKMFADERITPFFEGVGVDRQIQKQKAFMTMVFGGPTPYSGKSLRTAHRPSIARGLSDVHIDIFLEHFAATLRELGIAEDLVKQAVDIANSYRDDVLDR